MPGGGDDVAAICCNRKGLNCSVYENDGFFMAIYVIPARNSPTPFEIGRDPDKGPTHQALSSAWLRAY